MSLSSAAPVDFDTSGDHCCKGFDRSIVQPQVATTINEQGSMSLMETLGSSAGSAAAHLAGRPRAMLPSRRRLPGQAGQAPPAPAASKTRRSRRAPELSSTRRTVGSKSGPRQKRQALAEQRATAEGATHAVPRGAAREHGATALPARS